ncbi:hypothetical protein [Streptomyces sp. NPDC057748]|uniref:hypothetical protein n=1 Tax=unclassified Streptomyces TaxID=2593676 RepID=UPI00368E7D3E
MRSCGISVLVDGGPRDDFDYYDKGRLTAQADKLLALNEDLGGKGVRYMVSNEWGAAHVNEVQSKAFPEAYASGQLKAYHVPGNGMSGMSPRLQ